MKINIFKIILGIGILCCSTLYANDVLLPSELEGRDLLKTGVEESTKEKSTIQIQKLEKKEYSPKPPLKTPKKLPRTGI